MMDKCRIKQFFAIEYLRVILKKNTFQVLVFLCLTFKFSMIFSQEKKNVPLRIDKRCLVFSGFAGIALPGDDLSKDYGTYGEIGGGILYQSRTKWLIGLEGSYFFGNGVKTDPVSNLRNAEGSIVGNDGSYATFKIFQRGAQFPLLKFGKTISLKKNPRHNKLGGLTLMGGGGWFQHWTYIQDLSKKTDQFSERYIDGYDRLTNGPGFGAWVGYIFLPTSSKINFHLEGGYFVSFTERKRYDFANNLPAGQKRTDSFFQLRLKICFTVRSKAEDEFYYN